MSEREDMEKALADCKARFPEIDMALVAESMPSNAARTMRACKEPARLNCDKCKGITEHFYVESKWHNSSFRDIYQCRICAETRQWG